MMVAIENVKLRNFSVTLSKAPDIQKIRFGKSNLQNSHYESEFFFALFLSGLFCCNDDFSNGMRRSDAKSTDIQF